MKSLNYQLDTILQILNEDENLFIDAKDLFSLFNAKAKNNINAKQFELLLEKLEHDGYILGKEIIDTNTDKLSPPTVYRITFHGRQFINNSFKYKNRPYKAKSVIDKIKNVGAIIKTITVVVNAIVIMGIAAIGVWVSYDSKQKDREIKELKLQNEKLSITNDSLKTN